MPQIFIHRYICGIHGRADRHLTDDDLDLLQVYLPVNCCLPLLLVQGKTFSDNCTHPMCGHCLVKGGDFFSRRAAGHDASSTFLERRDWGEDGWILCQVSLPCRWARVTTYV